MYTIHDVERCVSIEAIVGGFDTIHPNGFVFNDEMHDFWEVVFVSDGAAVATADERVYNLTTGKLLFHKPMEFHRIRSAENSSPHVHIISFVAKGDVMQKFEGQCFDLDNFESEEFIKLCNAMSEVSKIKSRDNLKSKDLITINTAAVLLESFLLELTEKKSLNIEDHTDSEIMFKRIINIMQENLDKNLSVSDIAELSHMSISNMKRIFSMYSDKGVAKHYLKLKLRKAAELLSEGKSSVAVSDELMFSSPNYFHTVFKREFGTTPANYRKTKQRITENYTEPY